MQWVKLLLEWCYYSLSILYLVYRIYTFIPYYTCPKIWGSLFFYLLVCLLITGWVANSVDTDQTLCPIWVHIVCSGLCVQIFRVEFRVDTYNIVIHVQSNLNSSHTDGSFTMANSNWFFSVYEILSIAQENKYLRNIIILSWNFMLCVLIRIA